MLPKTGIVLPKAEVLGPYAQAIAYALKAELGPTHQAVKTVMGWTGAGERTVKMRRVGSWPSNQAIKATDTDIDFNERGGWLIRRRVTAPVRVCVS
jgi:hypothetical protein